MLNGGGARRRSFSVLEVIETMKRAAGVDFDVSPPADWTASTWARKVKIYTRAVGLLSSGEP
jgi:hypothetical protein